MEDIYCFWLMPEEKAKRELQSVIDKLAVAFKAVSFEPHVTLSVVGNIAENHLKDVLGKLAVQTEPFFLQPKELLFGDTFTQAAYLVFR